MERLTIDKPPLPSGLCFFALTRFFRVGAVLRARLIIACRSSWKTFLKSSHIGVNRYLAASRGWSNHAGFPSDLPGTSCQRSLPRRLRRHRSRPHGHHSFSCRFSHSRGLLTCFGAPFAPTGRHRPVMVGNGGRSARTRSSPGSRCGSRGVRFRNRYNGLKSLSHSRYYTCIAGGQSSSISAARRRRSR